MNQAANANLFSRLFDGLDDPKRLAIETQDGGRISYGDLIARAGQVANVLASRGVKAGDRVAAQTEKPVEGLVLYLATVRAGAVYLPLNTAYTLNELEYFITDAEPSLVVCDPGKAAGIGAIAAKVGAKVETLGADGKGSLTDAAASAKADFTTVKRANDDLAAILYTSGTTGRSKGAMLPHANLASNALVLLVFWCWLFGDVMLHTLQLFHVHVLFVASLGALLYGSKMIFLPKFDSAEMLTYLSRSTIFMGVPTYYVRLLADPKFDKEACRNMRLFVSGSAPLLAETFSEFKRRTGQAILERYGMSETVMLTSNPYSGKREAGTVGLPLPGVSVRVVKHDHIACETGEIGDVQVKGPNVFKGFWRMADKTTEEFTPDGFFMFGDVGKFDVNGFLLFVGCCLVL